MEATEYVAYDVDGEGWVDRSSRAPLDMPDEEKEALCPDCGRTFPLVEEDGRLRVYPTAASVPEELRDE